jgi:hydrogenase/urease accessory protein HupE
MKRIAGLALALVFVLFLFPAAAQAHLVTTGLGPVYDGIGHLFLTPEDWLAVVAVALLAGLCGPSFGRRVLFALPLAWLAGGIVGLGRASELSLPLATTLTLLALGALVALGKRLPMALVLGLAVFVGALHGYLNGTAMSAGNGLLGLLGVAVTLFVLVALVAAFVVSLRAPWTLVAVRVAGSWIAAISMLILGWTFRGGS